MTEFESDKPKKVVSEKILPAKKSETAVSNFETKESTQLKNEVFGIRGQLSAEIVLAHLT